MYTVECDGTVIYDDSSIMENVVLLSPKLDLSDNTSGSFTATVPTNNVAYSLLKKVTSTIVVKKDSKWLWEGRFLRESEDFYGQKMITCEGALSYLNDTILPPKEISAPSISYLITQLLHIHNSRITNPNRKIFPGAITVKSASTDTKYYTNCENLLAWIKKNLLEVYKGHIFISKENGVLKLNYYEKYPNTCAQQIDFGENLIDFTKEYDFSEICTVCIPRGKQLDNSDDSDEEHKITKYLTIESVNNGSIYLENATLVQQYGRVERTIDFGDVDEPQVLLELGKIYLNNIQFSDMILTVKAVDLHMLNSNIDSFDLLDEVRCFSIPHGLDKFFPITNMSIPLDKPEDVVYTLGTNQTGTMSDGITSSNLDAKTKFNELPTRESVLIEAKRNATDILNKKTTGFVSIVSQAEHSQALVISNTKDWKTSSKYWKFDMNGLGYYENGKLSGIAITMDGHIVADFITVGTMSADRIRTGIIKDIYNNNVINLETGEILLQADKTKVQATDGAKYNVASQKEITSINNDIIVINKQQATFKTDITGLQSDVSSLEASYGTCYTVSSTAAKVVKCTNFKLKTGAVIVVYFSQANKSNNPSLNVNNTGAKYITINGQYLTSNSKYNWSAGQTVHFVYDGSNWRVADGATESHIRQLANSISLSVTGALGGTASITLSADGDVDQKTIDMSKVRAAFANDKSTVTITGGRVQFNAGTFVLRAGNCSIDANGHIQASNATMSGTFRAGTGNRRTVLTNESLIGYNGENRQCGYISPGSNMYNREDGRTYPSLQIQTNGFLRISSPGLSVLNSSNQSATTINAPSRKSVKYITNIESYGDGSMQWWTGTMDFINGILVAASS